MDGAHLRLEAVRVEMPQMAPVGVIDGALPRSRALAIRLDRRAESLRAARSPADALLGFALLPWCDVTLWSVTGPAPQGAAPNAADRGMHGELHAIDAAVVEGCAHAWLRVEVTDVDWALAYVERLPVQHAFVSKAWRWRWSSAAWHCGFGAKPRVLAPEWSGPARRDLWRERLAGAFVGRSDRSVPVAQRHGGGGGLPPRIEGSAVDQLAQRAAGHSPGMPPASPERERVDAIDPSQGELAVA